MELTRPKIESRDPIFFTGTRSHSRVSGNDWLFTRGSEFGPNPEIPASPVIQLRQRPDDVSLVAKSRHGHHVNTPGGGPTQMSGRWLIPAAGYYGVPTGKNGVAKMASLRLRIGSQITRKYAHNLLIDLYILNFYGKQH